jgi:hypothetical protein
MQKLSQGGGLTLVAVTLMWCMNWPIMNLGTIRMVGHHPMIIAPL